MDQTVGEEGLSSRLEMRERLESRVGALADSMVRRNSEALARECERIRTEAAEHLAAQCRALIELSRAVAAAERDRETRFAALEDRLRESLRIELERAVPEPLPIPKSAPGSSVSELWNRA